MASLYKNINEKVEIPSNNNEKVNNKQILFSTDEAYMVTSNIFDPYKTSSPSSWNFRLKERLKLFEYNIVDKEVITIKN